MTIAISTHLREGICIVEFAYSSQRVDIMHTVPHRHWDALKRRWEIPLTQAEVCARRFHAAGYPVVLDGERYKPARKRPGATATVAREDPVADLLDFVPANLRKPTYLALAKAWHPDAGGDVRLAQLLNDAFARLARRRRAS